MAESIEYGIKILFRDGTRDTRWYSSKRQRDIRLPFHKAEKMVKSAKPIERKMK